MSTRFTKTLKRSLLSAIALAVIVATPQRQADSQTTQQSLSIPTQLAQAQTSQNAVVAVESVGMTVSDIEPI